MRKPVTRVTPQWLRPATATGLDQNSIKATAVRGNAPRKSSARTSESDPVTVRSKTLPTTSEPAEHGCNGERRQVEWLHPQQTLLRRQRRHANVDEDDTGDEPDDEDERQEDAGPSVEVDERLAPVQEFPKMHRPQFVL